MSDQYIEIAPNYASTSRLAQTISSAMGEAKKFTLHNAQYVEKVPELMLNDSMLDRLNYLRYPQNIQPLVKPVNTPEELVRNAIAQIPYRQQLGSFYTKDTLGFINLIEQIQNGDMKHALATVMDYETITAKDAFGNEINWIYNAAFQHIHSDATIGKFKKNQFQNFFIGIYDKRESDYLTSIAKKVRARGVDSLTHEESVAFEYLSRLGASIRSAEDLVASDAAEKILLTDARKESFMTVENFARAHRGLELLGEEQRQRASSLAKKYNITQGIEDIVDNLVENIVNKDSMITGWNSPYDINRSIEMLETVPGAEQLFRDKIAEFGFNPDNYTFGQIRERGFDPVHNLINPATGQARDAWVKQTFGPYSRQVDPTMHNVKFENIQAAQALLHPDIDIYTKQHHNAGVDVLQESQYIFDKDSPLRVLMDNVKQSQGNLPTNFDMDFPFKGMLFQAQDGGSMRTLSQYNKDVFATIQASNGDIYTSTGFKLDAATGKWGLSKEYSPGAWTEGVTYEVIGGDYFYHGSKTQQTIAQGRPELLGEDLVRIDMRIGLLSESSRLSEAGQEIHSVYMTKSQAAQQFGNHFRNIGRVDEQGHVVLTEFGKQQAKRINKNLRGERIDYKDFPEQGYRNINETRLLDRAERSFTKRSLQTNTNAIMLRDILDQGTFVSRSNRAVELQKAVLAASQGNSTALETILQSTSINRSAADIVGQFSIDNSFNRAWFSNTFTIAHTMQKGSLFEQMHHEALKLLDLPGLQSIIDKTQYYNRNQIYSHIMSAGTTALLELIPENASFAQNMGWHGRAINDANAYWLNAGDFVKKYRNEHEVLSKAEEARKTWVKLDFTNPNLLYSEIKRVTGLTGNASKNERLGHRNLLDFIDYLSNIKDGRLDQTAKEEIQALKADITGQSNYEIAASLTKTFERLKQRHSKYGWAPPEVLLEHDSVLTKWVFPENAVGSLKSVMERMKDAALDEAKMLADRDVQVEEVTNRLINFMNQVDSSDYAKRIAAYDHGLQKASRAILQENQDAINRYAKGLVNMMEYSGLDLTVGQNSIYIKRGNQTFDITHLIPRLQSNAAGVQSWMMGDKGTRYVAASALKLSEDGTGIQLSSMMDYAQHSMFGEKGRRARRLLRNTVASGDDPYSMLEWILKRPAAMLREDSLVKGAAGLDMRTMINAKLDPILNNKSAIERIVKFKGNNEEKKQALNTLHKYLLNWTDKQPTVSLAEQEALTTLIYGENPLLANMTGLALNAEAKQTGSDSMGVATAIMDTMSDSLNDSGKMLANQLDNSIAFKTSFGQQERRILADGGLDIPRFGPLFATKTENALSMVTDRGITTSNRLVTNVVEANDQIKSQIYQMLVDKFNNDKTIADVFGARFMPYEGGGLISSRLWDVIQPSNTWQKIRWDRQKLYGTEQWKTRFDKYAGLQFENGRFAGYGSGMRLSKRDAVGSFYSKFFDEYRDVPANQDSILNVMYLTKEGNQIVDADTLKREVEKELGKTSYTQKEFIAAADSLYNRNIVARNMFDSGIAKFGFDAEKHESANAVRAIGQLYNGPGTAAWQEEEKLLRSIFFSDEFDAINKGITTDFRGNRSLTADIYYDIARMDFNSALFEGVSEESKQNLKSSILRRLNAANKTADDFYRIMDESRHRVSDALQALTGGTVFGKSTDLAAKHGNVNMVLNATAIWLQRQMEAERGVINSTQEQVTKDLQRAYQMLVENKVVTDRSGREITSYIDPKTGSVVVETGNLEINREALYNIYRYNGSQFDQSLDASILKTRLNEALSNYADIGPDGKPRAHLAEVWQLIDPVYSDKRYKITDRELASYTNTLWDEDIVNRIKNNMDEKQFRSIFGEYLDTEGKVKSELIGTSMWGGALGSYFDNIAFARYKDGSLMMGADEVWNESKDYAGDAYRKVKTQELVKGLGKNRTVSQQYADDLYEVASLKQASLFNRNGILEADLILDRGKIAADQLDTGGFFKKSHIGMIDTSATVSKKGLAGADLIYNRNMLIDVTDETMGLTRAVLGRDKIAVAGLSLLDSDDIMGSNFQQALANMQKTYLAMQGMDRNGAEFTEALTDYKKYMQDVVSLQEEYSTGNKIKTSKTARLYETRVPASLNNKVQVEHLNDVSMSSFMKGRTFEGIDLAEYYNKGRMPNIAVINSSELEKMGYTKEYFNRLEKEFSITQDAWLKKAKTEGFAGTAHRWPSDYWGSSMAVQIYVDDAVATDSIKYDEITSAFLKADSDGDWGQLMFDGASIKQKDGSVIYVNALSKEMKKNLTPDMRKTLDTLEKNHQLKMAAQMYSTNSMIARNTKYLQAVNDTYEAYQKRLLSNTDDPLDNFTKKISRIDLQGNISANQPAILSDATRQQYIDAFEKYRGHLTSAIEHADFDAKEKERLLSVFRATDNAGQAAGELQGAIAKNTDLRQQIVQNLGDNADAINLAFKNAATLEEARKTAIQRIARKGVGLTDTPFVAMDFLRMNALATGKDILSNSQNTALAMVKELTKEELLTTKKMNLDNIYNVTKNLDQLNTMISDIIHKGKGNDALKNQFVDFIAGNNSSVAGIARDPNDRYQIGSLLEKFGSVNKDGELKLDMRKIAGEAYEGLVNSSEAMRQNTNLFQLFNDNMIDASRGFKGRLNMVRLPGKTQTAIANNAIASSNGIEEAYNRLAQNMVDTDTIVNQGRKALQQKGAVANFAEKAVKNFKPGRNLAIAALTLAGAAVFGGYAGGNPARPAQQQAQEVYEQNPPPRNINMADPSLTTSSRKQPGYVININAQTQREKEYASRLITQAVTKNFQDTNVNVSMNVNQQPGNISGNDLMNYLEQAIY